MRSIPVCALVPLSVALIAPLPLSRPARGQTAEIAGDNHSLTLRLRSEPPGLSFQVLGTTSAGPGWKPLCAAPCRTNISVGRHTLGVVPPDGGEVVPAPPVDLAVDAKLVARFESRHARRLAGWIVQLVGVGVGLGLSVVTREECKPAGPPFIPEVMFCGQTHPYLIPGVATAVAGLLAGIPLLLQHDQVTLGTDPAN
jgi:hypothetical protein